MKNHNRQETAIIHNRARGKLDAVLEERSRIIDNLQVDITHPFVAKEAIVINACNQLIAETEVLMSHGEVTDDEVLACRDKLSYLLNGWVDPVLLAG